MIVSNWTAGTLPAAVRLNGAPLVQDVDYFPSVRTGALELWITLARDLSGAANRLEIAAQAGPQMLAPAGMVVDPPAAGGNGVFEVGETAIIAPSWTNTTAAAQSFFGTASSFGGPAGPGYDLTDNFADYGTIAPGVTASCLESPTSNCYTMAVTGARPVQHWDASFLDTPNNGNAPALRILHVGGSFTTCPPRAPSIASWRRCSTAASPGDAGRRTTVRGPRPRASRWPCSCWCRRKGRDTRRRRAPPPQMFNDVPASSPFCRWIEELARRGSSAGCGGGSYCPGRAVTREQMAVFVLAHARARARAARRRGDADVRRRPRDEPVLPVGRGARPPRRRRGMRGRQLLPVGRRDPRADGRLPRP